MRTVLPGLVVTALLLAGCAGNEADRSSPPTSTAAWGTGATATLPPPEGDLVEVDSVVDGDSVAIIQDGRRTEVRLAGINAPEANECFGDEAQKAFRSLVTDEILLVRVEGEDNQDQFGRLLRNVWVGGTWVNLELVQQGAAIALQRGTADEDALVAAEEAAWQSGAGLWGSTVCGGFTEGMRITDIRFDPPGRDFESKNEEFVLMANQSDETIDLSGWVLRDESSTHRYVFAPGRVVAPGEGLRVRSGCGQDEGRDLHWCAEGAVWSNGGDTVILQTATGTVVDRWKYAGDF